VTRQAAFDAWLASECGLAPHETWQLSQQELLRLKLGWVVRQQESEAAADSGSAGAAGQRRKVRQGHRERRDEMLSEVGIH